MIWGGGGSKRGYGGPVRQVTLPLVPHVFIQQHSDEISDKGTNGNKQDSFAGA